MKYSNLLPASTVSDEIRNAYKFAKQYGMRCQILVNINLRYSVPEHGYATHCTIGPKGGRYVHLITDSLRIVKRSFSSVAFHDNFNPEPEFKLEN